MKKKYLLLITLFVSLFLFVGCGKEKSELVGTWKGLTDGESREYQMETTYTFDDDGTVKYSNEYGFDSTGTYKIDGNKVTIKLTTWDKEKVYEFSIKDDKLTLTIDDQISPTYTDMVRQ